LTPGDWIALAALCGTAAATGLCSAWWIVRMFWKIDVRLSRIETQLGQGIAQVTQRAQSGARVLRKV